MRHPLILLLVAFAVWLIILATASRAQSDGVALAIMEFTEKTQLMGVTLLGKNVFINDAQKKAKGKECLYVYEYKGDGKTPLATRLGKQVLAFHCQMVERSKSKIDVLTLTMNKQQDMFEIKEIQFAGTDKGHRVLGE